MVITSLKVKYYPAKAFRTGGKKKKGSRYSEVQLSLTEVLETSR